MAASIRPHFPHIWSLEGLPVSTETDMDLSFRLRGGQILTFIAIQFHNNKQTTKQNKTKQKNRKFVQGCQFTSS